MKLLIFQGDAQMAQMEVKERFTMRLKVMLHFVAELMAEEVQVGITKATR